MLSQLKKFARTVKSIREAVKPASGKQKLGSLSPDGGQERKLNPNMDLQEMLRTDISGLDATVTGRPYLELPPFTFQDFQITSGFDSGWARYHG